jgi:hypothetical protein
VNEDAVIVEASIERENATVTAVVGLTPFAPFAGVWRDAVGGGGMVVLNDQRYGATILFVFVPVIDPSRRAV